MSQSQHDKNNDNAALVLQYETLAGELLEALQAAEKSLMLAHAEGFSCGIALTKVQIAVEKGEKIL
ncbi:MAG: hypothetical protein ACPGQQ_04855 [Candidatus Puniceispirillaceae bacterium]